MPRLNCVKWALALLPLVANAAPRLDILHSFKNTTASAFGPSGQIVFDAAGTLYGSADTYAPGLGEAYRLSPPARPGVPWTYASIFRFKESHVGLGPIGLTAGADGLFGTTAANRIGGPGPIGCGSVFSLQRHGAVWKARPLLNPSLFATGGVCGFTGPVTRGADGALFGTAGGAAGELGGIYEVTPPAPGQTTWQSQILYSFTGNGDGIYPASNLLLGIDGALYGQAIGTNNAEPVYRLAPPAPGQTAWHFSVIWAFAYTECTELTDPFVMDSNGSLYGTCYQSEVGLPSNNGEVFRLDPPAAGQTAWTRTVLWQFTGGADGAHPSTGLVFGPKGQLYGTTNQSDGCVFELIPPAPGQSAWTERTLWTFSGADGKTPSSTLVVGRDGAVYGTTVQGGPSGGGEVFKLQP